MKETELTNEQELLLKKWKTNLQISIIFTVFYFIDIFLYFYGDLIDFKMPIIFAIFQLLAALFYQMLSQKAKKTFLTLVPTTINKKEHKLTTLLKEKAKKEEEIDNENN